MDNFLLSSLGSEAIKYLNEFGITGLSVQEVTDPNVWELDNGFYSVSAGFVSIDSSGAGFYVEAGSLLFVTKNGDNTKFLLQISNYQLPYEFVTGYTDGTTADWWGIESEKNKTTEITEESTDEQYPTAKATYALFSGIKIPENHEIISNKVTEITEESTDEQYPSAKAVKQAIDEALEGFEPPEQDTGSGVSEAQRQTLLAVINAIGLFNVDNAQVLLDNFNKAWDIVEPVPATSITLDKTEITFTAEETQTIVASVLPLNTTDVVVWKSSNTSIATVKDGVVTPLIDGEAVITATAGNVSATCKVTVNLYGEIENPVYLYSGYLNNTSTATSDPTSNNTYINSSSLTAIPVSKGSTYTVTTIFTQKQNQIYNQWNLYDENGMFLHKLWSRDDYTTVTADDNGFIRYSPGIDTSFSPTGLFVTKVTVTTNGEATEYTVVDKRQGVKL